MTGLDFWGDHMKNKSIFLLCTACLMLTACGKAVDDVREGLTEGTTIITEVTDAEFTDISESTAALSLPIEDIAHAFAGQVFTALQNNKTAVDPIPYAPISTAHEIRDFDLEAMKAELRLLDIDFDGVPELFTTSHGNYGNGRTQHIYCRRAILWLWFIHDRFF